MEADLELRDVVEADLPVLYAHHRDPEAAKRVGVPPRDRATFVARWKALIARSATVAKAVVLDGEVAGYVVLFEREGQREVGYWLGRAYWGRGLGTRAVRAFLAQVAERPLVARVAAHNAASRRVLARCGFEPLGDDPDFARLTEADTPGLLYRLR